MGRWLPSRKNIAFQSTVNARKSMQSKRTNPRSESPQFRSRNAGTPILLAAPHRPFFLAGVIQAVATMLLWLVILGGWYIPAMPVVPLTIFGTATHTFLQVYGLFTFFVFGFILTVLPRWLAGTPVSRGRYTTIAALMAAGMGVVYAGFFNHRLVAFAGGVLFVAGWGLGLWTLLGVWRASRREGKGFALFPLGCITAGALGAAVYVAWLATSQPILLKTSVAMGLWLYLVPLIVAVSHRMIPFFSAGVLRDYQVVKPGWTLPATLLCVVVHFLLTVTGHGEYTLVSDLPLALLVGWHSYQWGLARSLRVPLLGVLHISFAWLGVAMALYAIDSLLQLGTAGAGLGFGPLHALGIGFVSGMVVAMATRVSMGHSGRPLVADRVALWTFALVQVTAVVRVLAEIVPLTTGMLRFWLILAAAILWLAAFVPWSVRFGAIYLRPRIDGQPG